MLASDLYPLYMMYRRRGLCPLFSHWAARRDWFTPRKCIAA